MVGALVLRRGSSIASRVALPFLWRCLIERTYLQPILGSSHRANRLQFFIEPTRYASSEIYGKRQQTRFA
jgi:hypothetical protein